MFCEGNKCKMWCMPLHRNVQDVRIQRHADELMCVIWGALSHTAQYSRDQQVNPCMHHVLQWDQQPTPAKDAIKKPLTSCPAHGIMRMMWCIGSQSCVSQLASCFIILSGYKLWVQICLHHEHQRIRNRTQNCTTPKQILLCYSFFCHLACCILLSVAR